MTSPRRGLFVLTILAGSFLLFLVQPLVARMALPQLGGTPAVWNSAMLVYQALLLGGYAYAHAISRLSVARQAAIHLALLALAALTLPIALAELPPAAQGYEALWVPLLFLATIGPVFFVVSAQAPLIQRWFAADPRAGDPYWLYAASNLGSFAGLLAYPLLLEPRLTLAQQSWLWSAGYGLLAVLVALAAASRWRAVDVAVAAPEFDAAEPIGRRRILLWLALAAIPSGLMLSTTTHLTTDIVAMPLLWVIPLGLYLLSFTLAFNERSALGHALTRSAPAVLLLAGGMAMVSRGGSGGLSSSLAALIMLFVVAVALHRRLYLDRPTPERLTFFYLVMSAGGALGGLFAALVAPVLFDWVWEHSLLVLAAAALLPNRPLFRWMERLGLGARAQRKAVLLVLLAAAVLAVVLNDAVTQGRAFTTLAVMVAIALCGLLVLGRRQAFVLVLLALMLGRGGYETLNSSLSGARERSYFGVYHVREDREAGVRELTHGTTLHGVQFLDPARALSPTTYYGPDSGVGLVLEQADELVGPGARIGIVGLGVGTLACYSQPDQEWEFFEIDPTVLEFSRQGRFTFLCECTPDAAIHIGDARMELEQMPDDRFDILAIDAFSSDSIPLHLVTREAFAIYDRVLAREGLLAIHISNRFVDLRPMIAALAAERGLIAVMREGQADRYEARNGSLWVVLSHDAEALAKLVSADARLRWHQLPEPAERVWTDDFASILPFAQWQNMLGDR